MQHTIRFVLLLLVPWMLADANEVVINAADPTRHLNSGCPWGTTGTFETTGDCIQNSEITVSGHLVLKGVENAATLVKVTRGGGSSTQKRFFRLGHTTQERSLEISWLHFTGGRAIEYGNSHGMNRRNNAGFVFGLGSHYSLILRDSEVSDMQAQKSGAVSFCQFVEWNDDGDWPVESSEVGKTILIYFDVDICPSLLFAVYLYSFHTQWDVCVMQKEVSFIVNCYDLIFIFYYLLFRHILYNINNICKN